MVDLSMDPLCLGIFLVMRGSPVSLITGGVTCCTPAQSLGADLRVSLAIISGWAVPSTCLSTFSLRPSSFETLMGSQHPAALASKLLSSEQQPETHQKAVDSAHTPDSQVSEWHINFNNKD
ncbi:hypothetical protein P7K49_030960 [Saguinus oedipus]|uniref:Uncharacterized protein n=1 Tax=Saguinus oedipus TaxID=9490 RepID=A0ABQ9U3S8_SAGOE|nr:hypothetical protein P7K49_030960 [Saguinus oedipus]